MHDHARCPGCDLRIRPLDPRSPSEVELVAARMRRTLAEVLGEERGAALYTMDWLKERVRWHLDPERRAQVLLAVSPGGGVLGHTIVRVETGDDGAELGLFSTTYVAPEARGRGVATHLLLRGEGWMIDQRMPRAVTYTSTSNVKLIGLYRKEGYTLREGLLADDGESPMVELAKELPRAAGPRAPAV